MDNTTAKTLHDDNEYGDYEFEFYVYEAFEFEHPIYLFIWEILVVISVVVCTLFILTLLRKKLRSVTSYTFCAIAISDVLTGLVTLPTYIMVYQRLSKAEDYILSVDSIGVNYTVPETNHELARDAYLLGEGLCDAFMMTKFFWSKLFHTISIWLVVFLSVQRYLKVSMPLRARVWFSTKKVIVIFVLIILLALVLHGFHIFNSKKVQGYCTWTNADDCSDGTCVQLLVTLVLRHLIPCTVLTLTTVFMLRKLLKSPSQGAIEVNDLITRQVSRTVTAIVIVVLITEVPYGIFLFYAAVIEDHASHSLKINRTIHVIYEITMVLSFNANFVIYTSFNRRFRNEMKQFLCCKHGQPAAERQTSPPDQAETEMATLV